MKKTVFLLFLLSTVAFSQSKKEVLLNKNFDVDYLGIDFSKAKLVGTWSDFKSPRIIQQDYFLKWNNFVFREPNKYNIAKALRKKNVHYAIETVEDLNASGNPSALRTQKTPKSFTENDLQEAIKLYKVPANNEISFVLIVNQLNKLRGQIILNYVFFNSKTKQIIEQGELRGAARGLGFRNYWLGSIYDVLKQLRKKEYKNWKKEYK